MNVSQFTETAMCDDGQRIGDGGQHGELSSAGRSVAVRLVCQDGHCWQGSLRDFLRANEYERDERALICSVLRADGRYHGGGGAAPEFTLELCA